MSSNTSASPAPASASPPIATLPESDSDVLATKAAPSKKKATKTATKAAPKAKKAASSKAAPAHPSWKEIIKECIANADTPKRKGVSRSAIKKYAEEQYHLSTAMHISQLNRAIAAGVESGAFVQPKGPAGAIKLAPKVAPEASKENSKPVSKTKPASKTAATKAKPAPAKVASKPKATVASKTKPSAAVKAKTAVVGKKAAPATKAKAAPKKAAAKPRSAPKKVAA